MGTFPHPHGLLIDNAPSILNMMREVLQEEGYRVTVSPMPLEPARLVEVAPDVIVQELIFVEESKAGWTALIWMQRVPEVARIPVVLCTAASERVQEPAMAANLDRLGIRVVLKPFLLEDLLLAVTGAITAQTLLDQVRNA